MAAPRSAFLALALALAALLPAAEAQTCTPGNYLNSGSGTCVACPAATYSLGGATGGCSSCPATAAFVSATQGCAPLLGSGSPDSGVAFALSGSQAEGASAFLTVNAPTGLTYVTGPFGVAASAMSLASGTYLASGPVATAPASAPQGVAPMSASAWVQW